IWGLLRLPRFREATHADDHDNRSRHCQVSVPGSTLLKGCSQRSFEVVQSIRSVGRVQVTGANTMTSGNEEARTRIGVSEGTDNITRKQAEEALLKAGALQSAIFNSANFSSIATDAKGVIQIFNVGAERMLGYTAAEVMNKITPADISDPQELIARAKALSVEIGTPITPGFEALVFKASREIEDIYELPYIRKDGTRFGAVVSVTALRDAQDVIIGYLLIGTDNTARQQAEEALLKAGPPLSAHLTNTHFPINANVAHGMAHNLTAGVQRVTRQL